MRKRPESHLVNAALASAVLYFVLDLSRSGRSVIDWTVIALVALAILWNLFQLGRRLFRVRGARGVVHLLATVTAWITGLFSVVFVPPELAGTWRTPFGWACLVVAFLNSLLLFRLERAATHPDRGRSSS